MDIRTKLIFALVAVALGSMLVLGLSMYANAESALRESRLERLQGLAESKKDGLEQVFAGWIDRVSLVSSRTQLRLSLREHNLSGDPAAPALMQRILEDAVESVEAIRGLAVLDQAGEPVASTGEGETLEGGPFSAEGTPVAPGVRYQGVSVNGGEKLRVGFLADLLLEGRRLGTLRVVLDAEALRYVAEDRFGMGKSGETILVTRNGGGTVWALRRSGPGDPVSWAQLDPERPNELVQLALEGKDTLYWQGVTDDRGEAVWAAVRHIPRANLALVVMVDEEEERTSLLLFRRNSVRLALSLGAFAILLGTLLGFRFSKPIVDLAEVADRIREGALSARAREEGEDEVGLLARTFNDMAEEMEEQLTLLREFQRYFDLSLDMLCIAGPDGYFRRVNPAFERTLGWKTEELLSHSFLEFVHPDDLEKTMAEIDHLNQGLPTISFENRYRTPAGDYRHLLWTAHPDQASGLIYAIARDVTDLERARARTEEELQTLRKRLEAAEARLRDLP